MATESDLRNLLQGPEPEGRAAIDLDAVLTRARRRRRPKVIAVQALGSVAVVGGLFTAVVATMPPQQQPASLLVQDTAEGSAEYSMPQSDEAKTGALDVCGEPPTPWPLLGWELDVTDADAVAAAAPVVTITLRNAGPLTTDGEVVETSVTFVRDGIVVGHGASTGDPVTAALDAAESVTWDAPLAVTPCDPAEPLGPGTYEVRAIVRYDYAAGGGPVASEPIVGTPTAVELR